MKKLFYKTSSFFTSLKFPCNVQKCFSFKSCNKNKSLFCNKAEFQRQFQQCNYSISQQSGHTEPGPNFFAAAPKRTFSPETENSNHVWNHRKKVSPKKVFFVLPQNVAAVFVTFLCPRRVGERNKAPGLLCNFRDNIHENRCRHILVCLG